MKVYKCKRPVLMAVIGILVMLMMLGGCAPANRTPEAEMQQPAPETAVLPDETEGTEAEAQQPAPETTVLPETTEDPEAELPEESEPAPETTVLPETTEGPEAELPKESEPGSADAAYYIEKVYSRQIQRYHTPLREQWDVSMYFDNGLSMLPSYYYTGNPLENVGFGLVDLDGDGSWELVIGAIFNGDRDPSVFEIWTLVQGEPVLLAQGHPENRYLLQYEQETQSWYVANEASISMASYATYYLKLENGQLNVVQGVLFDAIADEENPWFLTYDRDEDTSNDTPISEETAMEILDSNQQRYTAAEYIPYAQYP